MKLESAGMSKRSIRALRNSGFSEAEKVARYIEENSGWCMCESNEKGCIRGIGRKTGTEILECLYASGLMSASQYEKQLLNIKLSCFEKEGKRKRIHPAERERIISSQGFNCKKLCIPQMNAIPGNDCISPRG